MNSIMLIPFLLLVFGAVWYQTSIDSPYVKQANASLYCQNKYGQWMNGKWNEQLKAINCFGTKDSVWGETKMKKIEVHWWDLTCGYCQNLIPKSAYGDAKFTHKDKFKLVKKRGKT